MSVYEIVTNKIIEELEKGVIPWEKPWFGSKINYETRKSYKGVNLLLLPKNGEYLTYHQVKKHGGKIRKGAKSYMVVFYKPFYVDEDGNVVDYQEIKDDGDYERKFMLRYYRVFHLDDIEGVESKIEDSAPIDSIEEAEKIVNGYKNPPKILENGDKSYYAPSSDTVVIPPRKYFKTPEGRYETLFHELVHSTGHPKRLNRFEVDAQNAAFGSVEYSKEELVAEIGTAFLCSLAGIEKTFQNSVAYIQAWIQMLKNDKKMIISASAKAQKAVEYILSEH